MVQIIVSQPFQPGVTDWVYQYMERPDLFPFDFVLFKRINTEEADEPLIQQELISEFVRLGAA